MLRLGRHGGSASPTDRNRVATSPPTVAASAGPPKGPGESAPGSARSRPYREAPVTGTTSLDGPIPTQYKRREKERVLRFRKEGDDDPISDAETRPMGGHPAQPEAVAESGVPAPGGGVPPGGRVLPGHHRPLFGRRAASGG